MDTLPAFPPLPPVDLGEAVGAPSDRPVSRAELVIARLEDYRRRRAAGIAEFLADCDQVTADALSLGLDDEQLQTFVQTLQGMEMQAKAEADDMDLEGRRAIKKAVRTGQGDLRAVLLHQNRLAIDQQLELCEALRDRRFRLIAEIDRRSPSPRGRTLNTGDDVEAYLASLRKQ